MIAGKDFDQGGFASAVLSNESMDLAGCNVERSLRERRNTSETFVDAPHGKQVAVSHRRSSRTRIEQAARLS
jgi:hypothetical protein